MARTPIQIEQVVDAINSLASPDDDLAKRSNDSAAMVDYWDKTDDIVEGYDAIKRGEQKYLPKFPDENDDDYKFRLETTKYTNVYRDIVENLASKPFEEEISLPAEANAPEEIEKFLEDVDGAGNNLTAFAGDTFFNGINSAIDWIFVDYPSTDVTRIRTLADAKIDGIRPFWSHVLGRNVLEAKAQVIAGEEVLTYIRILEPGKPNHIRIFSRSEDGFIFWELYEEFNDKEKGKKAYRRVGGGTLTIDEIPLVPFITGRRDGRSFKIRPVMRDAADLQIELYQQESALKYTKVLAAYPMLSGNGVKPALDAQGKPIKISVGPGRVLYAPPDGSGKSGSWAYVEPNANTLKFLAEDVKVTEQQLRELGRQPLTAQSGNLTVITTAVAAGKAKSAVGAWGLILKNALENALVITCKWLSIATETYDPEVKVYDDYDSFDGEGKDVEALNQMRTNGDLSQDTLWSEMKRRRILSAEFDIEKEKERLLDEIPADPNPLDTDPPAPEPGDPIPDPIPEPGNIAA